MRCRRVGGARGAVVTWFVGFMSAKPSGVQRVAKIGEVARLSAREALIYEDRA